MVPQIEFYHKLQVATPMPIVTIVTIVLNDEAGIAGTIESVVGQTFPDFEYIVLDGGSKDGTVERIKLYEAKIARWLSEADRGIYDAMNKGAAIASGEWILYLNSGDRFHSPDVLSKVFNGPEKLDGFDLLYGDVAVDYGGFVKNRTAGSLNKLWQRMQFSHQSLFTRRQLLLENPFNTDQKIAGDYEFIIRSYSEGRLFKYVPLTISLVSTGGVSDVRRIQAINARKGVVSKYMHKRGYLIYYSFLEALERVKIFAKNLLPTFIIVLIQKIKR